MVLGCLFYWDQDAMFRGGCSEELVSRSGYRVSQEGTLGKTQGKGAVMWESVGTEHTCQLLIRGSSQGTLVLR